MPAYPFDDLIPGRPVAERAQLTDEAISAELDGELEAFAHELGLDVGEVRRRLQAWPGFDARLDELRAARTALRSATPPVGLDDITRRRMLAAANADLANDAPAAVTKGAREPDTTIPLRHRRTRNRRVALLAAAAVVVVAVGGVAILRAGSGGGTSSTAAGSPTITAVGYVGDLGDVTDPNVLRTELAAHLDPKGKAAGVTTTTTAPLATDNKAEAVSPELANTTTNPPAAAGGEAAGSTSGTTRGSTVARSRADADRCAAAVVREVAPGRKVLLTATGVYRGQPAVIVTIPRGDQTVSFIADLATCAVVGGQSGAGG